MAGIYIHVPYCKVKCHYCDFHFSTNHQSKDDMVNALLTELTLRKDYLGKEVISTIYFGGGTPSVFSSKQIGQILGQISHYYSLSKDIEISLECNPDDLNKTYLSALKALGINRLSIGIQSFDDKILKFMNRAHTNHQTELVMEQVLDAGFKNITVDLIYGVAGTDLNYWKKQLDKFLKYNIPHLSAYCLTIEPKTYFGKLAKSGKLINTEDAEAIEQFQYMMNLLKENGYEQYEISNFAKNGMISKHNSAYWLGEKYLGIGPSAHSFNGTERTWNISNNHSYINAIKQNQPSNETELLTTANKFNEYILTRLRTKWGINTNDLRQIEPAAMVTLKEQLKHFISAQLIHQQNGTYFLTDLGKYQADGISAELFIN